MNILNIIYLLHSIYKAFLGITFSGNAYFDFFFVNVIFYNKVLDSIIKDLRRFRHNYNNILSVFGGYIKTKKWKDVERYYTEICGDMSKVSFLDNLSMANIKNAGVTWLIMGKYECAREMSVDLKVVTVGVIGEIGMKMALLGKFIKVIHLQKTFLRNMISFEKK